jgi:hypothetical protein
VGVGENTSEVATTIKLNEHPMGCAPPLKRAPEQARRPFVLEDDQRVTSSKIKCVFIAENGTRNIENDVANTAHFER